MKSYYELSRDKKESVYLAVRTNLFGAHFHKGVEIICCLCDRAEVACGGTRYHMTRGAILVADSYEPHSILTEGERMTLILPPAALHNFDAHRRGRALLAPYIPPSAAAERVAALMREFENHETLDPLELQGMTDHILGLLCRVCGLGERRLPADTRAVRRILVHMEENCRTDLTLESTAQALSYSKFYVSHLLGQTVQMNFSTYLSHLRLSEFERMLSDDPTRDILAAAMDCGFRSAATFYRVFRRFYGTTPGAYARTQISAAKGG